MVWGPLRSRDVCLAIAGKAGRVWTDLDGKTVEYAHVDGEYCCVWWVSGKKIDECGEDAKREKGMAMRASEGERMERGGIGRSGGQGQASGAPGCRADELTATSDIFRWAIPPISLGSPRFNCRVRGALNNFQGRPYSS